VTPNDPYFGLTSEERARQEEMQRLNEGERAEIAAEEASRHPMESEAYQNLADEEKERLLQQHERAMEGPPLEDDAT
jgi:hypothetical protein